MRSDGQREAELRKVERRLARAPGDLDLRCRRAGLLAGLGQNEAAKRAYLELLAEAPGHFTALNDFATLLHATGYRTAARTAYAEAVARHPNEPIGRVNLANLLAEEEALMAARGHYEAALRVAPDLAEAHRGLARILTELGEAAAAAHHRRRGFAGRFLEPLPYRGTGRPVPILLLVSALGGNIPTHCLVDDRTHAATALVTEYHDPAVALPVHRLIVNAVGDADLCADGLAGAEAVIARSNAPVINPPAAVRATARVANAHRLARLPGVVAPRMATLPRDRLSRPGAPADLAADGFTFPLLLRSPGFHTGRHFARVERAAELQAAVAALPGAALTVIEFLDARGADGRARKYRAMTIAGRLYPLHLAVAAEWKVHYFTAGMADDAAGRAEEARFLSDMAGVVGERGLRGLEAIAAALGLDYGGIDFGLGAAGEILLFEANATMVVNPPEPDPRWDYRRAPIERVRAAVREMLAARAANAP